MTEMLDIYDANLQYLGVKPRDAVHHDGDWHCVFHCWVIGQAGLIVQKRGADKETFPHKLDVSAAGHYEAGETMRDGVREVREELGIDVKFEELIPAGRRVSAAKYGDLLDYEVADVFFLIHDRPLARYDYQRDEVAGLLQIPLDDGLRLFAGEVAQIEVVAVGLGSTTIPVRVEDFIPVPDHYFHKVFLLAQRCLRGERPLLI